MIRLQKILNLRWNTLTMLITLVMQQACSSGASAPMAPPPSSGLNRASDSTTQQDIENLKNAAGLVSVRPRPDVSVFDLDDSSFRINALRVGMQDFMQSSTPVIIFELPEQADYVEIIRCKADTIIRGTFDNLRDVDLGTSDLSEEVNVLIANDFWRAASEADGCLEIATNYSDNENFLDVWALTGDYRYIVRACVDDGRIKDPEALATVRSCSRQVGISPIIEDFVNERVEAEREALQAAQELRMRVDGLGREIYNLTLRVNNAFVACQDAEIERQAGLIRKDAISSILGFGVTLGAELLSPGSMTGQTHYGSFQDLWEMKDTIAGASTGIAGAIRKLFASPSDYPRTCTEAKQFAMEGKVVMQEIRTLHGEYAQKMDEAEAARTARESLESKGEDS